MTIPVLRFTSKEEEILVKAAEGKARQIVKYAGDDWDSITPCDQNARVLTQVHRIEKK
jgi:hypothetical protein